MFSINIPRTKETPRMKRNIAQWKKMRRFNERFVNFADVVDLYIPYEGASEVFPPLHSMAYCKTSRPKEQQTSISPHTRKTLTITAPRISASSTYRLHRTKIPSHTKKKYVSPHPRPIITLLTHPSHKQGPKRRKYATQTPLLMILPTENLRRKYGQPYISRPPNKYIPEMALTNI